MKPDPDRQAIIDEAVKRFRKSLEDLLPGDKATLDEIENAMDEICNEVIPDLQKNITNSRSKKARDNQIECSCGGVARYRGMSSKSFITCRGVLKWRRPGYYCDTCKKGCYPLDTTLGLDGAETTLAVREHIAALAPSLGFVETKSVLFSLLKIDLSASTIERVAVSPGTKLRASQVAEAKLHSENQLPDRRTACPQRLYIGADGVMALCVTNGKRTGALAISIAGTASARPVLFTRPIRINTAGTVGWERVLMSLQPKTLRPLNHCWVRLHIDAVTMLQKRS